MNTAAIPRSLWRIAGVLALVHVAFFIVTAAITGAPTVHDGQEGIEHSFVEGGMARIMTGGYVNVLGFLSLIPVMVFLARAVGRRSEGGRWAAQTAAAAGLGFVVVIIGSGFAPGAAALWGTHNGLDLETALVINNIRNFAYFLTLPLLGTFAIGVGISALSDRVLTHWVGWGGVAVGAALMLAIPAAGIGLQYGMPLWLLWWLGVGIALLRHDPAATSTPATTRTGPVAVGSES
ncbi:MAG: hypothetical protein ACR2GM_07855 [Nocardioidaceae bacterium]